MQEFDPTAFVFYGNGPARWALAAGVFVLAAVGLRLIAKLLLARMAALAGRTRTDLDDLVASLLRRTRTLFVLLVSFWLASMVLALPPGVEEAIGAVLVVGVLFQAAFWGTGIVDYAIGRYRRRQLEVDPGGATAIGAMSVLARGAVWLLALLLVLENLDVDVTALITGLGIGGIAVALALQNVLSDLFASLSIVLDKPFVVGDFIVVGEFAGTVEYVGLKTTRIRSLSGEQLVFSNSDLLSSRIRNYKRMTERRAVFQIGITYETPPDLLERVPALIREAIEAEPDTRFDRSHFMSYGPSSLDFETVYFLTQPDYNAFMDAQHRINLHLFRRFQAEGIEFAYPTQTLHLHAAGVPSSSDPVPTT